MEAFYCVSINLLMTPETTDCILHTVENSMVVGAGIHKLYHLTFSGFVFLLSFYLLSNKTSNVLIVQSSNM